MDFSLPGKGLCGWFSLIFHGKFYAQYHSIFSLSTVFNWVFNTFNIVFHISTV